MKSYQQQSYTQKTRLIFKKQYENRSTSEHKKAISFLQPYFVTLSSNTINFISFYIELIQNVKKESDIEGEQRNLAHGILITITHNKEKQSTDENWRNPEVYKQYKIVKNETINFENNDESFGLYIAYDNYLSCINLGESTMQEELQFLHTSQFLCSMPKKKYFTILRNSKVIAFTYRELIYFEGQLIVPEESGSGVYLLRLGEVAYVKNVKGQSTEVCLLCYMKVYRFGNGHFLGTIEPQSNETKRLFGVKCKSGHVLVYHMTHQFFTEFIKPYCESMLVKKQQKLQKFLSQKKTQLEAFRTQHQLLNVNFRRSFSHAEGPERNQSLKNTVTVNMFTQRDLPTLIKTNRKSEQIQRDHLRKSSYLQLRYDGPLKNYPKVIQRSKFLESQFESLDRLKEKNQKISKVRNIKNIKSDETRMSIMFKLFQNSWRFEKQKRRRNFL